MNDDIEIEVELSDEQIAELFAAFQEEDWSLVDALLDAITPEQLEQAEAAHRATHPELKAGGADRNRGNAETLRRYWTVGKGGQKIQWRTSGDWTRCVALLEKHLGTRAKGYCNLRHKEMNGFYPGDRRNQAKSGYHDQSDGQEAGMEYKSLGVKEFRVLDQAEGIVSAIISVTGVVDEVKDIIEPGAYTKTLAKRTPKGVFGHDWNTPIAKTLAVKELMPGSPELPKQLPDGRPWPREAGAVLVKAQFNLNTQRGREAFSDVEFFGDEQAWSLGYHVPAGAARYDSTTGIRHIKELDFFEYSPVLHGAMPLAHTVSVKSAQAAYRTLQHSIEPEAPALVEEPTPEIKLDARSIHLLETALVEIKALLDFAHGSSPGAVEVKAFDTLTAGVKSLEETLSPDVFGELVSLAEQVDGAFDEGDEELFGQAAEAYLSFIEENLQDADEYDEAGLRVAADALSQMIEPDEGEDDMAEDEDDKTVVLSEKSLLSQFDLDQLRD